MNSRTEVRRGVSITMSDENSNDNQGDCFHVSEDGSAIKYDDKEYDLVPASYWLSLGYSKYAANTIMLNFQINMHKMRREIMNGGGTCAECGAKFLCVSMEQSYDADGNLPENEAYTKPFFIKYDDILRHEWQLTMNVLSEVTGPITSFSVANVELPADIMNMVVSALQDKQPREIRLCNNILGKEGILSVAKIVENAPSLEYLLLDGNEMSDRNCFIGLLGAIKAHPVPMKLVSIEGCAMGNIDIMSELLPVMENVVFLDLSANGLTDDAAKVIAGALKTNSNLKRLHLFRNAIGKAGLEALFQAIFDTRSMNSIIESNHSCDIYAGGLGREERFIISLLEYDVGGLKLQFIPALPDMKLCLMTHSESPTMGVKLSSRLDCTKPIWLLALTGLKFSTASYYVICP